MGLNRIKTDSVAALKKRKTAKAEGEDGHA